MSGTGVVLVLGLILTCRGADAVPGDLNMDGKVDFDDFFMFADNFGKVGSPEVPDTVRVTVRDTLERIVERTVHDTVWMEREVEVVRRDTEYVPYRDTVYVSGTERPPLLSSWSQAVDVVEGAVYWIGYTAKPTDGTRYNVVFVGTGWAVDEWHIATNYHVASYVDEQFKLLRSDLDPAMIAVRAGTQVFREGTYYLGTVSESRDLLGYWDSRYDFTTSSPDIAMFTAVDPDTENPAGGLDYLRLAPVEACMGLQVGQEIGVYGFPGVLETNYDPYTLTPIATFKSGTISALRAYSSTTSLSRDWKTALMGHMVQHNLEIVPGNSGSPIFNLRGEVVAIAHAGLSGGNALDFGIRADEIREFFKALHVGNGWGTHPNAKPASRVIHPPGEPYPQPRVQQDSG